MMLKRKRNLKIEVTAIYSVFLLRDLGQDEIEDYVENRDTGMEAEEEKELPLQNVIKGTVSNIPIPVIVERENPCRSFFGPKELKRRIFWEKDCPNEYVEDRSEEEAKVWSRLVDSMGKTGTLSTESSSFIPIESVGIFNSRISDTVPVGLQPPRVLDPHIKVTEREGGSVPLQTRHTMPTGLYKMDIRRPELKDVIKRIGNDRNAFPIKDEYTAEFCLRRTLVRYEREGFEAYTCFRDRIFTPTFKSRRNEALMFEKINRMGMEFSTLRRMCEMYKERCMLENRMYSQTMRILKRLNGARISKRKKRMLVKMMYRFPEKGPASEMRVNVYDIMTDRQKMVNIRNMKSTNELYLDIKYYNEVMCLIRLDEGEEQGQSSEIKVQKLN